MNKITLTQVNPGDARCGRETVWVGFAPPEGEAPRATFKGLRDMFLHLWTALNEVSWRADMVVHRDEPYSAETRQTLENIAHIANVDQVYRSMHKLLADEASKVDAWEDRLRERCSSLTLENAMLRRELAALKEAKP